MGIQDREYYRSTTRGSAWFTGVAPACRTIILINVVVFLIDKFAFNGRLAESFGATTTDIFQRLQLWRLLTATFLHDPNGIFHLAVNMLFLFMVGREMEAFYGSRNFVALYLSAAVFSTFCWAVVDLLPMSRSGLSGQSVMVGASGVVMAIVVLYTLYNPKREVLLFFAIPMEMRWLLTLYIGYDLYQLLVGSDQPVAFAAHLGGAAFGYLYKVADLRYTRLLTLLPKRRPKFRVYTGDGPTREVKVTPRPSPPSASASPSAASNRATSTSAAQRPAPSLVTEEQLNAKLDEILVKIARDGRDSLSDEEKRILEEASRRARNRRSERI